MRMQEEQQESVEEGGPAPDYTPNYEMIFNKKKEPLKPKNDYN